MLIQLVLPAIVKKFPVGGQQRKIRIQQDNAPPHIRGDDNEFLTAATNLGLNVELFFQPANSPDCNVCDLGFFRGVQMIQYEKSPKNMNELVESVKSAFDEYSWRKLNNNWLTLQTCFNQIIKNQGSNNYSIVHMNKAQLERLGQLPRSIMATEEAAAFLKELAEEDADADA